MKKPLMKDIQSIIDSFPLPYQSTDAKASIIHVNKAWLDLLGYSRREVINKWFGDFLTLDSAKLLKESFPKFLSEGSVRGVEYTLIGKDGRELIVSFDGNIEFDEKNQFKRTHCFFKDNTERKLISEKLLKNENRYSGLFNSINSGVAVYEAVENGRDFTFTDFNEAAEKIDKIPREKVIGRKVTDVFPGIREMTLLDGLQRVWKTGKPEHHPATIYEDNLLVGWRENYIYKLPTGEIVAIYEDITERVQAQQEIEMLLKLSRQAGTETSLNDLLFFIADQIVRVITPAEAASVFLYDEKRKVVRIQAWAGFYGYDVKGIEFSVSENQFGRVILTKKPALIKNVAEDPDFEPVNKPGIIEIKSQIIVPLVFKKRVIGIIYADNLTRMDAFSQKNLDLLESIGNQLAGMIENTRLLDQESQSHKQLSQSEKRLLKAQQIGHLGFSERDLKTNRIFLSDETSKIYGFKLQEGLATYELLMKAIHPDDREFVQKSMDSLIKNGGNLKIDHRIILPDGEVRWVNKQSEITYDADGSPGTILGTVIDITERVHAEQELRESEEKFQVLFKYAPDAYYLNDTKGNFLDGNLAAEKITGYKRDELIGTSFLKKGILSAGQIPAAAKMLLRNKAGHPTGPEKFDLTRKDGVIVPVEVSSQPVKIRGEQVILGIARDITERLQAEQTLRESEEQYRNLFNSMLNGFALHEMIYDDGGKPIDYRFIEVNPAFEKMTGLMGADIVGKTALEVLLGLEPIWIENYGKVVLTGEPLLFEQYAQEFDKHFEVFAFSPEKNQFVTVFSDITERRNFTRELQQERDKAQKYLDVAEVMIVAINEEGEITLVNQKGAGILGYKIEELIGKNWFNTCLPAWDRKRAKSGFDEFILGGVALGDHFDQAVITRSGEERIIEWHSTPLWEWVDEEKHRIGSLSSGEDITNRVRAEQLLNALNRAAVAMGVAQTHQDIFNAVSEELKQLDISCMLFPIDETQSRLTTEYLSYESKALIATEKLVGIKHEDFSMSIDTIDLYREVVREKKAIFGNETEKILLQVLPKFPKKLFDQIIKTLHVQSSISIPLIVENQVIGVFSVQSDNLTQEDVPAVTAFAHQLSSAWNKTKLLRDLRQTVDGTIHTIAATVEARDPYTAGHQIRVADLAVAIANEMGLSTDQIEGIRLTGIVHDLGKIKVPAEILSKPGKISELEYEIIKTHSQVGFDLLKEIEFPWPIAQIVHQHHEKIDGSGYPQGLKGDEILLEARILTVSDIVEAMSSHRPYRPALGIEKALTQIKKDKGTLLDPDVVNACLKIFKDGYKLPEG